MPKIIALESIRHNGEEFQKGDVFEVELVVSDRLIALKSAELLQGEAIQDADEDELSKEEYKELYNKLDKAFTKEPLIEAAKEAGVLLTDDAKKKKESVIDEIIQQELEEEVLALKVSEFHEL